MPQIAETVRAFLEEVRFAVIATTNRDGSPHQAALWYELRGETIVMNTGAQSRKVLNLKRDPRASVTIVDSTQARHVTLEGTVSLDDRHVQEDLPAPSAYFSFRARRHPSGPDKQMTMGGAGSRARGRPRTSTRMVNRTYRSCRPRRGTGDLALTRPTRPRRSCR